MPHCRGKTVEEVWNAIHTAERRNVERNGTSTPPLDQQQTVGSFLQSIGALEFGSGDPGGSLPSIPSNFLPPAPELQVSAHVPAARADLPVLEQHTYAAYQREDTLLHLSEA